MTVENDDKDFFDKNILPALVLTLAADIKSPGDTVVFVVENDISLRELPFLAASVRDRGRGRDGVFGSIVKLSITDILHSFHTYDNEENSGYKSVKQFPEISRESFD